MRVCVFCVEWISWKCQSTHEIYDFLCRFSYPALHHTQIQFNPDSMSKSTSALASNKKYNAHDMQGKENKLSVSLSSHMVIAILTVDTHSLTHAYRLCNKKKKLQWKFEWRPDQTEPSNINHQSSVILCESLWFQFLLYIHAKLGHTRSLPYTDVFFWVRLKCMSKHIHRHKKGFTLSRLYFSLFYTKALLLLFMLLVFVGGTNDQQTHYLQNLYSFVIQTRIQIGFLFVIHNWCAIKNRI